MKKTVISLVTVAAVGVIVLFYHSPAFRTSVIDGAESITQWTPEAIEKNPVGYSQFVETQLKKDLKIFQETRKSLSRQMEVLTKMSAEKMKELEYGKKFATEFAEAITEGAFPVTLHEKSYTESQLKNQLAMTLAQIDGLKNSLAGIDKVTRIAEEEIQKNVVRIEDVESQLALMVTQREIFRSQSTSDAGLAMLTEARSVLEGNQVFIKNNPVRTISDLIKDSTVAASSGPASHTEVEAFLVEYTAKKSAKDGKKLVQTEDVPAAPGD